MQTFTRHEKKYLLNESQYEELLKKMRPYVVPDKFSETDISSIYYDTDTYELIRRSIEKPEYKEKLRIRAYGANRTTSPVGEMSTRVLVMATLCAAVVAIFVVLTVALVDS